jgi:2'-5' RNA ligase
MSRVRTFIAIDVDKTIRNRLVALQETLTEADSAVKWVEPENLHLTLLFLGEVDERELHKVCRAVADVCQEHAAFPLSIERAGCFPNPRRPRVLWVGVGEGAEQIGALHDDLELPLLELGCYRREERKYTPHLTIGRVKNEPSTDKLAQALAKRSAWHGGQTTVREVHVMSSELSSDGPTYAVMSRAKLKAE